MARRPVGLSRRWSFWDSVVSTLGNLGITRVPRLAWVVLAVQVCWIFYDDMITSQVYHRPPRPHIKPTESSPLSPFYDEAFEGPSRAFPEYPFPYPCGPLVSDEELLKARSSATEGLFFINQRQTGSTTLSGITARIARNAARRQLGRGAYNKSKNQTACTIRAAPIRTKKIRDRIRARSFLWSVVREPVTRLVSKFYHVVVSLQGKAPTFENFQYFVERNAGSDYGSYFKALYLRGRVQTFRYDLHEWYMNEILDGYDFMGVSERMDESLAVLQLLLGLETRDLLHLSSKTSGSYEVSMDSCIKIQPPKVTQEMKEYFYLPEMWDQVFEADVYVYRSVNKSLDETIASLGPSRVETAVKQLKWAQRQVQERCAPIIKFPCSPGGVLQHPTDCLLQDIACGYQCLDEVGDELVTNEEFLRLEKS